jgi:hypothetical protein
VECDGMVVFAYANEDYAERAEPGEIVGRLG